MGLRIMIFFFFPGERVAPIKGWIAVGRVDRALKDHEEKLVRNTLAHFSIYLKPISVSLSPDTDKRSPFKYSRRISFS